MADAVALLAPKELNAKVASHEERFVTLEAALKTRDAEIAELKTKAASIPDYTRGIVGGIPKDSQGYSIMKMAAYCAGFNIGTPPKYEIDVHEKLHAIYKDCGWDYTPMRNARNWLVPYSTGMIPSHTSAGERLVGELKTKMLCGAEKLDYDEARWLQKKLGASHEYGLVTKDIGTISDAAGGVLVGFPTLGELIDLQRNVEVFAQAGATEQALPPNGRLQLPKLSGPTTAFWVGEGLGITESTPATGYLDLQAKKLGIFVDLNNELVRFASITAESMVRTDMAKVAALKADLAMLEGTGGTQIKGLITYPSASSWSTGTDPLLTFSVTSNLLQVSDGAAMEALLPDTAGTPTAWIMRRDLWAKLRNRRSDAVTVTDAAGLYLANVTRSLSEKLPLEWDGTPVVRSSQVSNTRGGSTQTYVILGHFPDWITARFGVLEFLSSMVGDTQMTNDQTRIRCIQHIDAGPRHASSFVFADTINVS